MAQAFALRLEIHREEGLPLTVPLRKVEVASMMLPLARRSHGGCGPEVRPLKRLRWCPSALGHLARQSGDQIDEHQPIGFSEATGHQPSGSRREGKSQPRPMTA
jgi:hypothetical protein